MVIFMAMQSGRSAHSLRSFISGSMLSKGYLKSTSFFLTSSIMLEALESLSEILGLNGA